MVQWLPLFLLELSEPTWFWHRIKVFFNELVLLETMVLYFKEDWDENPSSFIQEYFSWHHNTIIRRKTFQNIKWCLCDPFPLKHLCWQWRRLHEKTGAHRATKALETSRRVLRMPTETFWGLGSLKCYFLNFGDYFTEFWRIWSQLEPMHHCSCEWPLPRRLSHRSPT